MEPPAKEAPLSVEINANRAYRALETVTIEFRLRNRTARTFELLEVAAHIFSDGSTRRCVLAKGLAPGAEANVSLQFEPARVGTGSLNIEVSAADPEDRLCVYEGSEDIRVYGPGEDTGFALSHGIHTHDIARYDGNQLNGMVRRAGSEMEINEDRLREWISAGQAWWTNVRMTFNQEESDRRRVSRSIICLPSGPFPSRNRRAVLESLLPASVSRIFICSAPEMRFGRHAQKNDAVLRFLPDFYNDERSKSISSEQFVVRFEAKHCIMALAPQGHATLILDGRMVVPGKPLPLPERAEIKIGSHEFTLQLSAVPRADDPHWTATREQVQHFDPVAHALEECPWDAACFLRATNGPEEQYIWLSRRADIDWETDIDAGLQFGSPAKPKARLSTWNGRFYLEALSANSPPLVDDRALGPGEVACLGPSAIITFGPFRFRWTLGAREW